MDPVRAWCPRAAFDDWGSAALCVIRCRGCWRGVIGRAGASDVKELFELSLFGGSEVGQYSLIGFADCGFGAFEKTFALGGELGWQGSACGRTGGSRHCPAVLKTL